MTLAERFARTPKPSRASSYAIEAIDGTIRVARSFDNYPAIVFDFKHQSTGAVARRLTNVWYSPPALVEVTRESVAIRRERLAVLECPSSEQDLHEYFLRVIEGVLIEDGSFIGEEHFDEALDALVQLFTALRRPARMTVQGLWAELAVLAWARLPSKAISAWHSSPRALHDFSAGPMKLEVKSTTKTLREHAFALDQLTIGVGCETLVASIQLVETSIGHSVFDLLALIRQRDYVSAASLERLESIAAESLGEGWRDAREVRFDLEAARESLRLLSVGEIPRVPAPVPSEVKDVRFTVDLSGCAFLPLRDAKAIAPFFLAILPP